MPSGDVLEVGGFVAHYVGRGGLVGLSAHDAQERLVAVSMPLPLSCQYHTYKIRLFTDPVYLLFLSFLSPILSNCSWNPSQTETAMSQLPHA